MMSRKGTSTIGRLTAMTAIPGSWSIRQGMPKPTAATSPSTALRTSSTASTHVSSRSAWLSPREVRWARWWTVMVRVDRTGEQLRAPEIDSDDARAPP